MTNLSWTNDGEFESDEVQSQMEGGSDLDLCTDGVFDFVKKFIIY